MARCVQCMHRSKPGCEAPCKDCLVAGGDKPHFHCGHFLVRNIGHDGGGPYYECRACGMTLMATEADE